VLSKAFSGWMGKAPGFLMRLSVALHFADPATLEDGSGVIPTETIERAIRLMDEFLIPNAVAFYLQLNLKTDEDTLTIASWILARTEDEISAREFGRGPMCCRGIGQFEVKKKLSIFITGGWLIPESEYPDNNKWTVRPGLREALAARAAEARERQKHMEELMSMSFATRRSSRASANRDSGE